MMESKEKKFISAVIYVHNAENRIEDFLGRVIKTLEDNFEHSEIICVNDYSDDNSVLLVKKASAAAKTASISILNMSYFHGVEMAMNAGVDLSIGDYVYEFDNTFLDFSEDDIMSVYKRSLEGYDIVSASPDRREKLSSRIFYNVFDINTNIPHKMDTESFRILSRRVINRISSMNKTVIYRKAVYANCGLKTDNIRYNPIPYDRSAVDKNEKKYRTDLAVDSLILFTDVGYRLSMTMTIVMMFISIFVAVYSVIIYVTAQPVAGWTTTIMFLSIAFLGLFGILTIIIKYLQLLVNLTFRRKHYSFESIEKLTK